jgi:hypothetical protein
VTTQRLEFAERAREVAQFIRWLGANQSGLGSGLIQTMRAAAFLLIYNMVESSARGLTEAIIDAIAGKSLALKDLSPHLRKEFLRQAYRKAGHFQLVGALDDPHHDVTGYYDPEELFSGNVDARRIRERLVELGCSSVDFGAELQVNTRLLVELKNTRNDLAHGVKSFATVGGFATQSTIVDTFTVALKTLRRAFAEVDGLLSRNEHLV